MLKERLFYFGASLTSLNLLLLFLNITKNFHLRFVCIYYWSMLSPEWAHSISPMHLEKLLKTLRKTNSRRSCLVSSCGILFYCCLLEVQASKLMYVNLIIILYFIYQCKRSHCENVIMPLQKITLAECWDVN